MKRKYTMAAFVVMLAVVLTGCSTNGIPSFRAMMLGEPEILKLSYDPLAYVKVGQYKNVEVKTTVSEKDIQNEVDYLVGTGKKDLVKSDAKDVKKGDMVNIDYSGTVNGTKFDGGTQDDQSLRIGSGSKIGEIDGFEEGLIGAKVGSEKKLNLKLPTDYRDSELAGKDVVFTVKINYVYKEANDEIVKQCTNSQYKTVKEFKEDLKKQMATYYEQNSENMALEKVMSDSKFEKVPTQLIEFMKYICLPQLQMQAQQYGMDVATFVKQYYGGTEQAFYESNAKQRLLVEAVAKQEGYRVTEEEYREKMKEILKENNLDEKTYQSSFEQSLGDKVSFEEYMVYQIKVRFYQDLVASNIKKVK